MNKDLSVLLSHHKPLSEETVAWDDGRILLREMAYLSQEMPPIDLITSVRAVVFRSDYVLVIRDGDDSYHILPGGRREEGESLEETLRREVLEETGWTLNRFSLLGFIHFQHQTPRPPNHSHPFPDFFQLVYVAEAKDYQSEAMVSDEWVLDSRFRPTVEVQALSLTSEQLVFFEAARRAVGLESSPPPQKFRDLDHLSGTWTREEAAEFDRELARQRQIDEEQWSKPSS